MKHSLLFTGHMIDAKDRTDPRFPADKENAARHEIRKRLTKEKEINKDELTGIASGACGGDILFHELCAEMDIPTEMYLALPVEEFKKESVLFAGTDWNIRFDKLYNKLTVYTLQETKNNNTSGNVWERTNLWMLNIAFEKSAGNMTLLALWDGKGGDEDGGIERILKIAKERGAGINIIDINKL